MTTGQKTLRYLRVILLMLSFTMFTMARDILKTVPNPLPNVSNPDGQVSPQNAALTDVIGTHAQEDSVQGTIIENYSEAIFKGTAYCPCRICCGNSADGITANGHRIKPGEKFVAADRRYAFGTMLRIPGYNNGKPVPVLDRGGAIKGNKLDVYFDSHRTALEWGVKTLKVER